MTESTKRGVHPISRAGGAGREVPTLIHDTDGLFMATWKNVALNVWTATATRTMVDALDEHSARFTGAHPEGISAVHVVANHMPLPGKDVREQLRQVSDRYAKQLACMCHVVEGSGFWASALHSFLTGLHVLTRGPFKLHICSDISAAARWLPPQHTQKTNVSFTSGELEDALAFLRRHAQLG